MSELLKTDLVDRLKQVGAFDVRVADPRKGFEKALPKQHPLQLWELCRSVVVFAVAMPPQTNNLYLGLYAPWQGPRKLGPIPQDIQSEEFAMDRLAFLFASSITLKGMMFLNERGYETSFSRSQYKLSAFEAGLGVYGRSGLILNPVLGNRMSIGVILTNASLKADGRLKGFHPCDACDKCIQACPAKAFDKGKEYPESWTRETCVAKRNEIAGKGYYCHNCFAVCPSGEIKDDALLSIKISDSFFKQHRFRLEYGMETNITKEETNEIRHF